MQVSMHLAEEPSTSAAADPARRPGEAMAALLEVVGGLGFQDNLPYLALGNGLAMCGIFSGAILMYSAALQVLCAW